MSTHSLPVKRALTNSGFELSLVTNNPIPADWTVFDLSPVVGPNRAVVWLRVENTAAGDNKIKTRPNGDTDFLNEVAGYDFLEERGNSCCFVQGNDISIITVYTDADGMIQMLDANNNDVLVELIAWIASGS